MVSLEKFTRSARTRGSYTGPPLCGLFHACYPVAINSEVCYGELEG